jgi:hypothetical protein
LLLLVDVGGRGLSIICIAPSRQATEERNAEGLLERTHLLANCSKSARPPSAPKIFSKPKIIRLFSDVAGKGAAPFPRRT